jgi:hypothetical protein
VHEALEVLREVAPELVRGGVIDRHRRQQVEQILFRHPGR